MEASSVMPPEPPPPPLRQLATMSSKPCGRIQSDSDNKTVRYFLRGCDCSFMRRRKGCTPARNVGCLDFGPTKTCAVPAVRARGRPLTNCRCEAFPSILLPTQTSVLVEPVQTQNVGGVHRAGLHWYCQSLWRVNVTFVTLGTSKGLKNHLTTATALVGRNLHST